MPIEDDNDAEVTQGAASQFGSVTLSEAIGELRRQLADAVLKGQNEKVQFEVGEVSVELSVVLERELGGSAGLKLWVVNAEANASTKRSATVSLTVPLTPRSPDGGPLLTGRS